MFNPCINGLADVLSMYVVTTKFFADDLKMSASGFPLCYSHFYPILKHAQHIDKVRVNANNRSAIRQKKNSSTENGTSVVEK